MTLPRISLLAFASFALAASSFADTVVLKSGSKIEGKITSETDAQLTIETKSGGIIDEQTIKKEDVASVSKASPDETAYAALRNIKLGANSLPTPAQYDSYLTPLKAFATQYPTSSHKAEIEKLAADFEAEQKRVLDGEVKLDGKWLSKTDVQRERYQINGAIAFNYLKDQAARNDVIGALNTFDVLEKQYPGSRGYVDAVDTVKRLLPTLKQQADARLARLPAEKAERERAVAGAAGLNKIELQKELEQEKQSNEAALNAAKRQGLRWPPFLVRSEESVRQIADLSGQEIPRIKDIDTSKARQSLQLTDQARAALDKKEFDSAEEKIRAAREAWNQNEVAERLEKALSDAKAATTAAAEQPAPAADAAATDGEKKTAKAESSEEGKSENTSSDSSNPAAPEEEPSSPAFKIALIVVLGGVAFAGWKAYSSIRKKASEVIE